MKATHMLALMMGWAVIVGRPVYAEVVMTEVYPAPSEGYEWVELCNTGPESVTLSQYTLLDSSGKKLSVPQILLAPQQYVLATSSSVLNNTGDAVYLQKAGLTIESMNYDTAVNAQQSYISCNAVWTLTNSVTPGFENVGCAITPTPTTSVLTGAPTITQVVRTPTPTLMKTPTPTPIHTIIQATPIPSSYTRKVVSFQQKHAPTVLGIATSASPSPSLKATKPKHAIMIQPTYNSTLLSLGSLLITVSVLIAGLIIYTCAQKMKNTYNEIHDT